MSKRAFGKIANVPWSTSPESAYDIIVESVDQRNSEEPKTLDNEDGIIQLHVQDNGQTEVTMEALIKGANHIGARTLVGSVITALSDTDIAVPLIIVDNGVGKQKREWQKCRITAKFYGTDFTTGTLVATFGSTSSTTTTTTGA